MPPEAFVWTDFMDGHHWSSVFLEHLSANRESVRILSVDGFRDCKNPSNLECGILPFVP